MNKSLFLSILLLALFTQQALAGQKKCRALALEAGGDLGAFEAGAFKAFVDLLPSEEVEYDVLTGVSIGSINSLGLAQFAKGTEKQAAQWLVDLWKTIKRTDIYNTYKGGIVQGLLYEKGIFDNTPGYNLLKKIIKNPPQRKLNLGTCDLRTGELVRYHENLSVPELIEAALASGSVPTFFPYSTFNEQVYVDGGTTGVLIDISGAIDRCKEVVEDTADIIVDVIFVQYAKLDFWSNDKRKKTMAVTQRTTQIQNYVKAYREFLEAVDLNPEVNFRYAVLPSKALYMPTVPFLFDNKQINDMITQGYSDATNQLKSSGPQGNAREIYEQSVKLLREELNTSVPETDGPENKREKYLNDYSNLKESLSI